MYLFSRMVTVQIYDHIHVYKVLFIYMELFTYMITIQTASTFMITIQPTSTNATKDAVES